MRQIHIGLVLFNTILAMLLVVTSLRGKVRKVMMGIMLVVVIGIMPLARDSIYVANGMVILSAGASLYMLLYPPAPVRESERKTDN
jgi:hypothetical protein